MIPGIDNRPTIGELLDLPNSVGQSDFVLKLTDAIVRPEQTVRQYVVTPQLSTCFDEALTLIRESLRGNASRAAYLHGSFGTGKSHFMAMLYLLLSNDAHAKSRPQLAAVVAKHSEWSEGKSFLLVPYHMIGAETVEERVLGGYVDRIAELHPNVAPPGVYRSDAMIENARSIRQQVGDEAFFRFLNSGAGDTGWGDQAYWDKDTFEDAAGAGPKSTEHSNLVGTLARTWVTSARQNAEFVDFDIGLSLISKHARDLGYDALILFLDELILWLASRSTDANWVTREGPKIAKLVESERADRPAPIISFVARQRAIKEMIGKAGLGADQDRVEKAIDWWDARFATVTLEDKNLAVIAQERLLKPRNAEAREKIAAEFEKTRNLPNSVLDALITTEGDREEFRKLYPFHPALIRTLVAVSSALQRERTVLNVMAHILVKEQDRMRLGDLVPVGELFAEMRDGHDPFHGGLNRQFENGRNLWDRKLRPLIEAEAQASFEDIATLAAEKAQQLRSRELIAGTLILSALAPDLETLKNLTGPRIAALNHGTIRSIVKGLEGKQVLNICRNWGPQVLGLRVGEGVDPAISVQLTGVDVESIIESAKEEDKHGARLLKIQELFYQELDLDSQQRQFRTEYEVLWRCTKRSCELLLTTVRDAEDNALKPDGSDWLLVVDLPIDRDGRGPADHLARVRRFKGDTRTLVWLPTFLSERSQADVARLVILDYLLNPNVDRLRDHAAHLPAVQRAEARQVLAALQSQLRERVRLAIREAYGVGRSEGASKIDSGAVDETTALELRDQFQSLDGGLDLKPPVAASLKDAMHALLFQAFEYDYPEHPRFVDANLGRAMVQRSLDETLAALRDREGRRQIDRKLGRDIRPLLEPLDLANVGEQYLYPTDAWKVRFERKQNEHGGGRLTVGDLRRWMDDPKAMGLPTDLQDLIILIYAEQSNRSFRSGFGIADARLGQLKDDWILEQQELPTDEEWQVACERAGKIFGAAGSPYLTAANLDKFSLEVRVASGDQLEASRNLDAAIRSLVAELNVPADCDRLKTSSSSLALLNALAAAKTSVQIVRAIAKAPVATSAEAMARSIKSAKDVAEEINGVTRRRLPQRLGAIPEAGEIVLSDLRRAVAFDELGSRLVQTLQSAESRATDLVLERQPPPPLSSPTEPPSPQPNRGPIVPPLAGGQKRASGTVLSKGERSTSVSRLAELVTEIRRGLPNDATEADVTITWEIRSK